MDIPAQVLILLNLFVGPNFDAHLEIVLLWKRTAGHQKKNFTDNQKKNFVGRAMVWSLEQNESKQALLLGQGHKFSQSAHASLLYWRQSYPGRYSYGPNQALRCQELVVVGQPAI